MVGISDNSCSPIVLAQQCDNYSCCDLYANLLPCIQPTVLPQNTEGGSWVGSVSHSLVHQHDAAQRRDWVHGKANHTA